MTARTGNSNVHLMTLLDSLSSLSPDFEDTEVFVSGNLALLKLETPHHKLQIASFQPPRLMGYHGCTKPDLQPDEAAALEDCLGTTMWHSFFSSLERRPQPNFNYDASACLCGLRSNNKFSIPATSRKTMLALLDAGFAFGATELDSGDHTWRHIYLLSDGQPNSMVAKVSWPC